MLICFLDLATRGGNCLIGVERPHQRWIWMPLHSSHVSSEAIHTHMVWTSVVPIGITGK
jgi:hypothetical protein